MVIDIVDVFAGPGGLNEGFSSVRDAEGRRRFRTAASFEMDPWACETLRLRATFRSLREDCGTTPGAYVDLLAGQSSLSGFYSRPDVEAHAKAAADEVHQLELGQATRVASDSAIAGRVEAGGDWVLIGGPPCQAYSLAGRSRRTGDPTFRNDHKHVLYLEYLHIIEKFKPAVFVMENVKGMLSSQHEGGPIFQLIKRDLERPGYEIRSMVVPADASDLRPQDFVIEAEDYGVPQRRHRVILLGVRKDLTLRRSRVLSKQDTWVTVRQAIGDLPEIRSQVSPLREDSEVSWNAARLYGHAHAEEALRRQIDLDENAPRDLSVSSVPDLGRPSTSYQSTMTGSLGEWLVDPALEEISLHQARRHMENDLRRYAFLAFMAERDEFPRLAALPKDLMPNHRNASRSDAPFADRFRVQRWESPSTTIVSHIAKDGHYYIHPDPLQMRSLTVREAARLQTFPDNYLFVGNRTQQYHQVGNAVPPLLAKQIGDVVADLVNG